MTAIVNKTPANIDSSVLNAAVTAVGKFLGTSSGYDMGTQFSKLDKTQNVQSHNLILPTLLFTATSLQSLSNKQKKAKPEGFAFFTNGLRP